MSAPAEEDIGQRALLSILAPAAHPIDSVSRPARRNKQRYRFKRDRVRSDAPPVINADARLTCVSIVERTSSQTVTVCWSDARMGHFAEQIWCLGRSCVDSFCVLTGKQILYGDKIFRPRIWRGAAPDEEHMILACAVDDAFDDSMKVAQTGSQDVADATL
jgi:hypothetical protein